MHNHILIMLLGILAQSLFATRILVQWIASERAGKSVVPTLFWYLSISGAFFFFVFAYLKQNTIFMCSVLPGIFVYFRNLQLIYSKKKNNSVLLLVTAIILLLCCLPFLLKTKINAENIPDFWLLVGGIGLILWSSRFIIQLIYSERRGYSYLPKQFWIVGLFGSVMLLSYAIYINEIIFIIAQTPNVFVYFRNLQLLDKKEESVKA